MNPFQWIALPVLSVLFLLELHRVFLGRPRFRFDRLVRGLLWACAAVAIYNPDWTSVVAQKIGIQRGSDLVLYLFALAFLGVSFYFYSRSVRLERQLTDLVRHVAIAEARKQA